MQVEAQNPVKLQEIILNTPKKLEASSNISICSRHFLM